MTTAQHLGRSARHSPTLAIARKERETKKRSPHVKKQMLLQHDHSPTSLASPHPVIGCSIPFSLSSFVSLLWADIKAATAIEVTTRQTSWHTKTTFHIVLMFVGGNSDVGNVGLMGLVASLAAASNCQTTHLPTTQWPNCYVTYECKCVAVCRVRMSVIVGALIAPR